MLTTILDLAVRSECNVTSNVNKTVDSPGLNGPLKHIVRIFYHIKKEINYAHKKYIYTFT